ncbi:MAG: hypothetical protein ABIT47_00735 [Candidatus Paceibacterota bacterium]
MKESSTSLRLFFGAIAVLYLISFGFFSLAMSFIGLGGEYLFGSVSAIMGFLVGIIEAIILLYFAITLPKYLNAEKVKYVKWFLIISFLLALIPGISSWVMSQTAPNIISIVVSALVTWYLFHNVSRLSRPVPVSEPVPAQMGPQPTGIKKRISGGTAFIIILAVIAVAVIGLIFAGQ